MSTRPAEHPAAVRGPARLIRGWAAAVVATLLAAGSHTMAVLADAGTAAHRHPDAGPEPIIWILTLALAGPLCTALAGRSLSWWRLTTGVSASQLLFHWLYSVAAVPAAPGVLAGLEPHAGHAGHGPVPSAGVSSVGMSTTGTADAVLTGTGAGAGVSAGEALHASPVMVAAHVLAAVGTLVLLRRGELLAAHVAALAAGLVLRSPGARLARWVPAVPFRRPAVPAVPVLPRPGDVLLPSLRLRGPPEPSRFALAA